MEHSISDKLASTYQANRSSRLGALRITLVALACCMAFALWLFPTVVAPARASGVGPGRPLTNRITTENALPGIDDWADVGNYNISSLSAFAGATSVNAGGPIGIHVKSTGTSM